MSEDNQWHSVDIDAHWTLQQPYVITHFCDDKLNYPDDHYKQMYDPDY